MDYSTRNIPTENTSYLPSISYFFIAFNSISIIRKAYAHNDYPMIAFIFYVLFGFFLLDYCSSVYQSLPPHEKSRRKTCLKLTIWFLYSSIMFGFAYQFAPFFSSVAAMSLYAVLTAGSAFLFYVYMIYDNRNGCSKGCGGDEEVDFLVFSSSDSVWEKV